MRKIPKFLFALICLSMTFSSCENAFESEIPSQEEIMTTTKNKTAIIDSLEFEDVLVLEETEDLKALKEKMEQLKRQQRSLSTFASYDDYDENFSMNVYNIREIPITIQARGQANTGNRYLQTNGKSKELTLAGSVTSNAQKFYLKVLPASSGIPYLIYSQQENTPISIGQYNSNPNNKVLFTLPDANGSLYSAGWDLKPCSANKGYFAIESNSYIGQSDPNNMWSIFYHVVEVQNNNKLGYAQYTKKATQEFRILPVNSFSLQSIIYDASSATITPASQIKIVSTGRNLSVEPKPYTIKVDKYYNETSYYAEKRGYLDFNISNSTRTFQRPTVQANRIVLPESSTPWDATYKTTSTQNISKRLLFDIEGDAPENCLIEVSSYIQTYNVNVNYTAKATYNGREIKISGTWRGYVILDPKIASPNHVPRFFDLTTGKEIIYFSRSVIKTIIKE
jgi:hypothetical protein